jgi:hypothetical protein
MQKTKFAWLLVLFTMLESGVALAQGATQTPAPAAQPATPAPAAQPAAEPAADADMPPPPPPCFPACREGFICGTGGQCVSACNPACGPGEMCSAGGQCVIDSQVTNAPEAAPQYVPPPAAPPPPPEKGVETHDGVMLRFALGIGGGSMKETFDSGSDLEGSASGAGMMGSIDIGAAITDELTIHGRIGLLQVFSPSLEENGEEVDLPYEATLVGILIGPGLTYNIMPLNLYITAVGGLNIIGLTFDEEDEDFEEEFRDSPNAGFGLNLDVGKEWWVTTQTGIGVAGRFWWGTGGAEYETIGPSGFGDMSSDRNLIAFGLLFSVTHQ